MKKSPSQFDKFGRKSNAARKEAFRQEKRAWKKASQQSAALRPFDKLRASQAQGPNNQQPNSNRQSAISNRPFDPSTSSGHRKLGDRTIGNKHSEEMPLNKFIAHAGVCGRREAAEMVKKGLAKVNGVKIMEPGHKVSSQDDIRLNGKRLFPAKDLVYILLNKPKDYITTSDDPQKRKTVLDLVSRATSERIFPVGRLDRNTSGVLLLTNDGELAQKLTHPSHEVKKVYAVTLNKPLEKKDFDHILKGVNLEDGLAKVDQLAYSDKNDKTLIGVEIHSGRNRIVRRIFEHLGYDVRGLDRVTFAGLTKKNTDRGKWRFLSEKEVRDLKYFGKGK